MIQCELLSLKHAREAFKLLHELRPGHVSQSHLRLVLSDCQNRKLNSCAGAFYQESVVGLVFR
ncbi:MAG: hypothetical protein VXY77_03550 [Pseudomonadota bacterium]|nr:hypothetical protein [Pseudomonadota bacterium]